MWVEVAAGRAGWEEAGWEEVVVAAGFAAVVAVLMDMAATQ